ncbi:TonB-dependent receptor, partial [Phenylobacterium sp.]|uniref:TonB-dependent receptor n=1 Tax=Phenylobacterium sp. TaxID=1871053 RepID=UPI003982F532
LGEVVVTAQRRAQKLQDVPLAVSAFDRQELDRRQITRTLDVVTYVPNMVGHNNVSIGTANTYSLRALNNTESISTFDPPVGTYVDDIYVSRQGANNFSFFDIDRLEVLRGPQGTLFGRNTTGGAVVIILKKPSPEFGGFVEAGVGAYSQRMVRGTIDVPINEKFLTKFSGFFTENEGYVTNQISGEKLNFEKSFGVRGAGRVLFSDTLTWDLSADYTDAQSTNFVNFKAPGSNKRINFTRQSKHRPLGAIASGDLQDNKLNVEAISTAVTSNVEWDARDNLTVNFISGYRRTYMEFVSDSFDSMSAGGVTFANDYTILTNPPGTSTPLANDSVNEQFSQEVKLNGTLGDRLNYVGGLYYINERSKTHLGNYNIPLVGSPTVTQDRTISNNTEAYAVYLQVDYKITDQLTGTIGARYTDENKEIFFNPNFNPLPRANPAFQPFSNVELIAAGIPVTQQEQILTPRFALDYKVTDDLMLFASATRGFKSGGWNARANIGSQAQNFTSEKIWSYETGLRSDWLSNRLRINLTGFYFNVTDYQLPAGFTDLTTNTIVFITRNFGDLKNYGLESEISIVPIDGLNVFWSAGIQKATYENLNAGVAAQQARCLARIPGNCNTGIVKLDGTIAPPARAPDFSSVLGVNYNWRIADNLELVPSISWSHIKGHFVGTQAQPISFQRTRDTYNAGITLKDVSRGWSLTAECTNCTNETYVVSLLIYPYLNEPRRYSIKARKDF